MKNFEKFLILRRLMWITFGCVLLTIAGGTYYGFHNHQPVVAIIWLVFTGSFGIAGAKLTLMVTKFPESNSGDSS